ncbi:MAG: lipid-A-disaccharide synthase [Puniceicoccales bacterium]|jgi:lipid-A-disaccharide synthase|nr:lipid-A-disaccharide synthase [Puniceicoccales bacterium]
MRVEKLGKEDMLVDENKCVVDKRIDMLVVAGEHSGDAHAAAGVRNLKTLHPDLNICAIGGQLLQQAGAHLLLDVTKWSVVGLVEVLKHYRQFKELMDWIVRWIEVYRPRIVCLVDFPGFNLRLAKKLFEKKLSCKGGGNVKIYAYIAPQIWAWRRNRRFLMAKFLDRLAVIFPFEKAYFGDTNLDVCYVGHPLVGEKLPFTYDVNGELLLLPGSRSAAVKRIFPILLNAFQFLKLKYEKLGGVVVYPDESIKAILEEKINKSHLQDTIRLCDHGNLLHPLKICGSLMSSGTASLKIALAGIPGVVVYRAHLITYALGKYIVKVPFLSMANILLKEQAYPEFLQSSALQSFKVAQRMQQFLDNPEVTRQQFLSHSEKLHQMLLQAEDVSLTRWLLQDL